MFVPAREQVDKWARTALLSSEPLQLAQTGHWQL